MQTNWVSNDDSNEKFWEHEWSKHGTCVSTLAPSCYGDNYQQYEDMIDFFQTAVDLHQQYNIYQALANAGYSPGNSYQLSDLEDAYVLLRSFMKPMRLYFFFSKNTDTRAPV